MAQFLDENNLNAWQIKGLLDKYFDNKKLDILDICCGAYDKAGTNYDINGQTYQPVVANFLAKKGNNVTGIDFRKNQDNVTTYYKPINDIDILEDNWPEKINQKFECIIFLRSWDTPELLLHYQNQTSITSINQLNYLMAKEFLPKFSKLLKKGGVIITSQIFNLGDLAKEETTFLETQIQDLMCITGLKIIEYTNGLYFLKAN